MIVTLFKLPGRTNRKEGLREFAAELERISDTIGFKISARGWCYQLEGFGLITKAEFDLSRFGLELTLWVRF